MQSEIYLWILGILILAWTIALFSNTPRKSQKWWTILITCLSLGLLIFTKAEVQAKLFAIPIVVIIMIAYDLERYPNIIKTAWSFFLFIPFVWYTSSTIEVFNQRLSFRIPESDGYLTIFVYAMVPIVLTLWYIGFTTAADKNSEDD